MAFTEFCCRSGGSNLNAGTRTGSSSEPGTSASFTYASGSWVSSTGVFTVASGNPSTDGVAVGDFASVYADGASVTTLVGRVTAVSSTTITVSTTAKSGSTTDGTGNRTLKIGGAWQGPNGTSGFPFGVISAACTNSSADPVCVNFKNDQTYSVTAAISHNQAGRALFQGYTTSYHDGGKATISGGTSGASYALFTLSVVDQNTLADLCFLNNGATGSAAGVTLNSANRTIMVRCVVSGMRGTGIQSAGTAHFHECEVYGNNLSNTASRYGINVLSQATLTRCVIHDNTGSNTDGLTASVAVFCHNCVFDTNGANGASLSGGSGNAIFIGCDFYNNTASGIAAANTAPTLIESCNFVKNGAYGINGASGSQQTWLLNCGFGTGTQANSSGDKNALDDGIVESGTVTYASGVTPWTDPANGDFRISLAAAKAAGRGSFTETQASYSGTVAYPDIGAAQSQSSASGGGGSLINSQQLVRQGWIG